MKASPRVSIGVGRMENVEPPVAALVMWLLVLLITSACGTTTDVPVSPPVQQITAVYLVPFGEFSSPSLDELARDLQNKTGLRIELLPRIQLEPQMVDYARLQLIAEELIERMRRQYFSWSSDPKTIFVGITSSDMYIRDYYQWRFTFSFRRNDRFAVVSSARMDPINFGGKPDPALLQTRVRKMVLKNIGVLYYRLPPSNNANSVLYSAILSVEDLDKIGEEF